MTNKYLVLSSDEYIDAGTEYARMDDAVEAAKSFVDKDNEVYYVCQVIRVVRRTTSVDVEIP